MEGFLIVLEVDETTAHPQDLIDLEMAINVTVGVIESDDRKLYYSSMH